MLSSCLSRRLFSITSPAKNPLRSFEFFGKTIRIASRPREAAGSWGAVRHDPNDNHDQNLPYGLVVWASATMLCGLLERNLLPTSIPSAPFADKLILEVGSGCGLVGLACAAAGADVVLTEGDDRVLPLLRDNASELERNGSGNGRVMVTKFDWCDPEPFLDYWQNTHDRAPDLVLASDLLYKETEDTWPQLAEALALITANENTSGVLLAYEERAYSGESNRQTSSASPTRKDDSPTSTRKDSPPRVPKFEDPFFEVAERWFEVQHIPVPEHLRSDLVMYGTNFWRGGTQPQQLSLDAVRVMFLTRKHV